VSAVTDPDLEIRGESGHPDPEIRGGTVSKKIFSALWAPVWSKKKGGRSPLAPPPLECRREEKARRKGCLLPFHSI